jgi:glycosyltransferase involved in cell wall biosynthesis
VLVVPSRTTTGWKEQFGRVIIEAMSCGVPVIGSSSGEIPRVIDDAGLIVAEGAPAELAAALRRLATTPALASDLAQRGRARVLAQYTQRAIAQATAEVYAAMRDAPIPPVPGTPPG